MANTLAIQQFSLRNFEGGWDAAFAAVKSMGITTIEPWCGALPNNLDAGIAVATLRASLERAGMSLTCGHLTVAEFDARYNLWSSLLRDFGSKTWVIPFAKADTLEEWLGLLPKFREMHARLKQDGIDLGYHNHHLELMELEGKRVMEHLLDQMPELKAQFHIGQFQPSRGISLPAWILKYAGRVCSLHVNDATESGAARLGEGECRAIESIMTALDTGVDTFIVEVELTRESLDAVKRDVETAQKLIL